MTGDFTREELAMLARHCDVSARNTAYRLKQLEVFMPRETAGKKRKRERLESLLVVYSGALEKLDALQTALGPLPGLRTGE